MLCDGIGHLAIYVAIADLLLVLCEIRVFGTLLKSFGYNFLSLPSSPGTQTSFGSMPVHSPPCYHIMQSLENSALGWAINASMI